jgi:hypothetical protein
MASIGEKETQQSFSFEKSINLEYSRIGLCVPFKSRIPEYGNWCKIIYIMP